MSPGRTADQWWARLDSNQGPTDYESTPNLAILLVRLAVSCLLVARFRAHLGPLVPKLFPILGVNP